MPVHGESTNSETASLRVRRAGSQKRRTGSQDAWAWPRRRRAAGSAPVALVLGTAVLLVAASTPAPADPRPFTYTYDLYPEGKGNWELEQWVTWRQGPSAAPGDDRYEFREEVEIGVSDSFDLSVYLASWSIQKTEDGSVTRLDTVGLEGIVYLTSPSTAPLGVGLYFEVAAGPNEIALEPKLLLQKDVDRWTFAYNLIAETEIEREEDGENEVQGALGQTLGVSYAASPTWQVGAEVFGEWVYDGWHTYEGSVAWAGPSISYRPGALGKKGPEFWATLTPNWQITNNGDEPGFQVRLLAGFEF
jgi:hypothetical protein